MTHIQPNIHLLTLGGTIAMRQERGALDLTPGSAALADVIGRLELPRPVAVSEFRNVPSGNILFRDLIALAKRIEALHAAGCTGIIVTQGTDTIEETAFALELLVQAPINIVVTGAMRGASHVSADGPANIQAAVEFLCDSAATGEVVVALDDVFHAARFVRKSHTTRLSAFTSGERPIRGRLHEGGFRAFAPPLVALPKISIAEAGARPNVLLLPICLDQDPAYLERICQLGLDGLVIDAFGAGHVPQNLVPAFEAQAARLPVVLCSRTADGLLCTHTYGYPGAEIDLLSRGLLNGDWLTGIKARILLTLLLMEPGAAVRSRFCATVQHQEGHGARAAASENDAMDLHAAASQWSSQ
ncbi:MAG: asparaginase [Alphaproteobacteria bacterium]|nr:asparaginase [Alphaproteobacteria bacterium]